MKTILIISFIFLTHASQSQTKSGTTFSGVDAKDVSVCTASAGDFLNEKQVETLIAEILGKIGIRSRYIIKNCTQVENCQALLYKGKPYILYNPNFLGRVKKMSFSSSSLPDLTAKDWETLTILAHELGHHTNNHLSNPLPEATQFDMELEADETAGFMIYMLGGTIQNAQLAFADVSESGSYTHPGRERRLKAVETGWRDAELKNPRKTVITSPTETKDIQLLDKDGNSYKTVKIGGQVWMAENLKTTHFRNGDLIMEVKNVADLKKATEQKIPAWCYYQNDASNNNKLGKLYNQFALLDPRGLAPEGWRISSQTDWAELLEFIGEKDMKTVGIRLKSKNGWIEKDGLDYYGFNGFPAGAQYGEVGVYKFPKIGTTGTWATTSIETAYGKEYLILAMLNQTGFFSFGYMDDCHYNSVRCVKE